MRVAIVDDHPLFSEGLKFFLATNKDVVTVVVYSDGDEFLDNMEKDGVPDVVFMDILMPNKNGIDATIELKKRYPDVKVIAMSSLGDVKYIEDMISADVASYILKDSGADEIDFALKETKSGRNYFSPKVLVALTQRRVNGLMGSGLIIDRISKREFEIFHLLCKGLSRIEIAETLDISEKTVDKHRENLLDKTGSENLIQLMIFGIKNNLVEIDW